VPGCRNYSTLLQCLHDTLRLRKSAVLRRSNGDKKCKPVSKIPRSPVIDFGNPNGNVSSSIMDKVSRPLPYGVGMDRNITERRYSPSAGGDGARNNRRGAVLPFVAASMIAFLSLLALVLDNGSLQRQRRMAQAAADAGARAGADEIFRNRPAGEIEPAAKRETERNLFTHGIDATVTVNYPTSSLNAPGSNFVEVVVQRNVSTTFASIFGIASGTVRARAVAGVGTVNTSCLTVTEPTSADALYVKSGFLTTVDCDIMVNSTSANAINVFPNGAVTAQSVAVVGGPVLKSSGIPGPYASGVPLPPGGADPLSALKDSMPPVGACNGAYGAYANFGGSTLSPGTYCGGIGIDHGGTVTLQPGLYIIAGGGLYFKSATVIGVGVTFVFTNAPTANGGAANFSLPYNSPPSSLKENNVVINMETNSDVRISAMTTGRLPGVLFYYDPNAGVPGTVYSNYLYSSSATALLGTLYMPAGSLSAKSHSDLTINGAVVVARVVINTGNEDIVIKGPSSGSSYYSLKAPTIVE
jgi:hypothetical protein